MNKKFYLILFYLISLIVLIVNIRVYISYTQQKTLLKEFNSSNANDLNKVKNYIQRIPNLTLTAVPIKSLLARYYKNNQNYDEAIALCEEGKLANPYVMISESILADIYDEINDNQNFKINAEKAFNNIPNNSQHLARYIKSLKINNEIDKLDSIFLKNDKQILNNELYLAVYLSAYVNSDSASTNNLHKKIAIQSLERYPENEPIQRLHDLILFGKINIDKSMKLAERAFDMIQIKAYEKSIEFLDRAIKLFPGNKKYFSLKNRALFELKNYEDMILNSQIMLNKFTSNDGEAELFLGIAYVNTDQKNIGCEYLNKSIYKKNKQAYAYKKKYCN